MPSVEFVGQSAQSKTAPGAGTSRLLNLYREPVTEGDNTRYILRPVPGQTLIVNENRRLLRQMALIDGTAYYVEGGGLKQLESDDTTTLLGSVSDNSDTTISGNNGNVTVVAGGNYYVWNGSTLSEPTAGAFSDFGSVDTIGQYTLLTEKDGRRIQWSALADPTSLGGLDFATTESRDDNNVRGVALNGNYWVLKERSTEIWYPTGSSSGAFAQLGGGVISTGLKSFHLVAKGRDALLFVGNDGAVYLTAGSGLQPVSTRPVERSIESNNPTHCFYYEAEGHKFFAIRFSDRPAWVYDFAVQEWHERSETVEHTAWDAVSAAQEASGSWLVGGELSGISRLSNTQSDKGGFLYRRAISRTLRLDSKRFRVPELEFYADYGRVAADSSGAVMMATSRDKGNTWANERQFSIGAQGEYETRLLARSLGQFRTFTVRLEMTHGYEVPLFCDARVRLA